MTLSIGPSSNREALEAQYGGTVVSWQPESGYAILGVHRDSPQVRAMNVTPEPNVNALGIPETSAAGYGAWSGGWNAWSGGWSSWSGGGASSLAPNENQAIWNKVRLAQAQALAPKAGAGIKVAVIDTGLDLNHPAFKNRLVPANEMYDWVDGDAVPQEVAGGSGYGHGTNVAGTVAQVAQKALIMPLRVLDKDGKGDTLDVIAAIDWAIAKGARVINLSLGSEDLKSFGEAVKNATKAGVFVVASAGNTGDKLITFPARQFNGGAWAEMAVGVGSSDTQDRRSRFSTYGKELEMLAPGEQVYGPAPENRLAAWSGTSMAAPMISGGLALALGERSYSNLSDVGKAIGNSADDVSGSNPGAKAEEWGKGRVNLQRFLQQALALKP